MEKTAMLFPAIYEIDGPVPKWGWVRLGELAKMLNAVPLAVLEGYQHDSERIISIVLLEKGIEGTVWVHHPIDFSQAVPAGFLHSRQSGLLPTSALRRAFVPAGMAKKILANRSI